MTRRVRSLIIAAIAIVAVVSPVLAAQAGGQRRLAPPRAQAPRGEPLPPQNPDVMNVQQVEEYFDNQVLFQARNLLNLSDDQFLRFGARLKQLQNAKRQLQRRRVMALRELNVALTTRPQPDEAVLTERLKGLEDVMHAGGQQIAEAYTALDSVLSVRQRAQYRLFEETTERRRLDLIGRARQQSRPVAPDQ